MESAGVAGPDLCAAYDPYASEVQEDPYPYYAALRDRCPVHHSSELNMYSVSRFDDVVEVLRRNEIYSSSMGPGPDALPPGLVDMVGQVLVMADEPAHGRQRKLVNKAFTPRRVQALEGRIEQISHELLDQFVARGSADFVTEYALPLPAIVIAEMFGVPREDRENFKRWAEGALAGLGGQPGMGDTVMATVQECAIYVLEKAAERRALLAAGRERPDDLLTGLVEAQVDGDSLDDLELVVITLLTLGAGYETTAGMIANLIYLLCLHPKEMAKIRRDPKLIENAVEEVLRYDPPVHGLSRGTTEAVKQGGVFLPADVKVRPLLASANRDPRHWGGDAEQFRVDRDLRELRQHLAFGAGIHYCVGAALARMEGQIALRHILDRLPDLALDPEQEPRLAVDFFHRTWETLPIRFKPGLPKT